jgi:nitroreductase
MFTPGVGEGHPFGVRRTQEEPMDVHEALRTRRTVQRFAPGPVSAEVLDRALQAAHLAPNHKLTWPWRFVLPGPEARERLFRVALRLKATKKGCPPADLEALMRTKTLNPDRLVVVTQFLAGDAFREEEDYAACCCAVQNLMLSLHADGVHSKWSTGDATRDPESLDVLGIDPERERVVGWIWVGHAEVVPRTPPRPDLAVHVRHVP